MVSLSRACSTVREYLLDPSGLVHPNIITKRLGDLLEGLSASVPEKCQAALNRLNVDEFRVTRELGKLLHKSVGSSGDAIGEAETASKIIQSLKNYFKQRNRVPAYKLDFFERPRVRETECRIAFGLAPRQRPMVIKIDRKPSELNRDQIELYRNSSGDFTCHLKENDADLAVISPDNEPRLYQQLNQVWGMVMEPAAHQAKSSLTAAV